MLKKNDILAQRFATNQEGIDDLKNEFFDEAHQFIYFRKGRWTGFKASLQHAIQWLENNPTFLLTTTSPHPIADKMIDDVASSSSIKREEVTKFLSNYYREPHGHREPITFRAIVVEGALTGSEIAQWERISDLKGSIMTIPTAQEGYFRYLINEKRFAIFCRLNENLLQGIIGYDEETIDLLKRQFDREFFTTAIRSGRRPARQHVGVPP